MGAIDNLLKSTRKDEEKDTDISVASSRTEQPTPKASGSSIDKLLSQTKATTRTETELSVETTQAEEPKKGFFGKALNAGKNVAKFGLDVVNAVNSGYQKAINVVAEPLSKTPLIKGAAEGYNAMERGEVQGSTFDYFGVELLKGAQNPTLTLLNTKTGKKVISEVSEKTSNIPLKTMARIQSIGGKTYEEAYAAWLAERNDPENPVWQQFLYELQDTGVQTAIGALLSIGTAAVSRNPQAGYAVSGAFYTALSADEQLQERGKVDSLGNIAIDVVGDQVLNKLLGGILTKGTKSSITSALQGLEWRAQPKSPSHF